MAATKPKLGMEEFARRGDEIFERSIQPQLKKANPKHFIVIDIESGDYEVDEDQEVASERLRARIPNAQVWLRRVGSRIARHFGGRQRAVRP